MQSEQNATGTFPQHLFWAGQRFVAADAAEKERLDAEFFSLILQGATDEGAFTEWRPGA